MNAMLPFQKAAFLELATCEPGGILLVLGKGLGISTLSHQLVAHFAHPSGLVVALGLTDQDVDSITAKMTFGQPECTLLIPFQALDANVAPLKREEAYVKGGVVACTARVCLLDLLQERLCPNLITGVLLFHCENMISEHGMEAFCLELIRSKNRNVFVRAVTERPEQLASRFAGLEKALQALHCSKVCFFPRFQNAVNEDLEAAPVEINEIKVGLKKEAKACQVLLLDLLTSCLKQLLSINPILDPEEYPVDNVLLPGFHHRVLTGLNSHRRSSNPKTLRLLDDMDSIKSLLSYNISCKERQLFWDKVKAVFASFNVDDVPYWMALDSAELLLRTVQGHNENFINPKLTVIQEIIADEHESTILVITSNEEIYDFMHKSCDQEKAKKHKTANKVVCKLSTPDWIDSVDSSINTIVLTELSLELIRSIEVFKATHNDTILKVYYLMFVESVEEQRYLASLRKENSAFERLIQAYATLPELKHDIVHEQTIDQDPHSNSSRFSALINTNSDKADCSKDIILDIRELRSALPFVLYKRQFRLIPLTLDTGDYILADNVCVERKSLVDLISSLQSGRLLAQSERMLSLFSWSLLLIELDVEVGGGGGGGGGGVQMSPLSHDLIGRLALLLIHRPKLRLLWSSGAQASACFFHDLKRQHSEAPPPPSSSSANTINADARNVLLSFRGIIDERNVNLVLNNFKSLRDLFSSSQDRIKSILGDHTGSKLFKAINNNN